jgi:hypothetical protein
MARRRSRDEDGLLDQVIDASMDHPMIGVFSAVFFGGFAAIIQWVVPLLFPKSFFAAMASVVAVIFWCLAAAGLLAGEAGYLADLLHLRSVKRVPGEYSASAAPSRRPPPPGTPAASAPFCPTCGVAMVERHARNEPGRAFWGCRNYPRCRRTLPLAVSPARS